MSPERPSPTTLARLYLDEGLSLAEVGRRFGYTTSWARKQLIAAGIPRRPPGGRLGVRRVDDGAEADLVEEISKLYVQEELSLDEIGRRCGRGRWWVRDRLTRAGVPIRRQGGPHGSVPADLVEEMKRLYLEDKMRTADIATRVGMSQSWVYRQLADAGVELRRPRLDLDEAWIQLQYVDERRSINAISEDMDVSTAVVRRVLIENGIPIRGLDAARKIHCDDLHRLYIDERLPTTEIAKRLGVTPTGVSNAMKRCSIEVRDHGTELTINTAQLRRHLDEGLANQQIAEIYGVATYAVTRRLRLEQLRRPHPKPDYTRPSPPPRELRALYVDRAATLAEIATHYEVPHATVGRWLDNAGIKRRPSRYTKNTGRKTELTAELLSDLYTAQQWTAAEIGRHVGVTKKIVLSHLHNYGIPVRPSGARRPGIGKPLLDQLYDDPAVVTVLDRHHIPPVRSPGALRSRFPDPAPLTAALVTELYLDIGLSASHISLVTGHHELAVRVALQEAGVAAREGSDRSPWSEQHPNKA